MASITAEAAFNPWDALPTTDVASILLEDKFLTLNPLTNPGDAVGDGTLPIPSPLLMP
jgi:hypothetical protein